MNAAEPVLTFDLVRHDLGQRKERPHHRRVLFAAVVPVDLDADRLPLIDDPGLRNGGKDCVDATRTVAQPL